MRRKMNSLIDANVGILYGCDLCWTECLLCRAIVNCTLLPRRNYRNEFTSRYDNQHNAATSFYRQIFRFFFSYFRQTDVRSRTHDTQIQKTDARAQHEPCSWLHLITPHRNKIISGDDVDEFDKQWTNRNPTNSTEWCIILAQNEQTTINWYTSVDLIWHSDPWVSPFFSFLLINTRLIIIPVIVNNDLSHSDYNHTCSNGMETGVIETDHITVTITPTKLNRFHDRFSYGTNAAQSINIRSRIRNSLYSTQKVSTHLTSIVSLARTHMPPVVTDLTERFFSRLLCLLQTVYINAKKNHFDESAGATHFHVNKLKEYRRKNRFKKKVGRET